MLKRECDVCGKEISDDNKFFKVTIGPLIATYGRLPDYYDVCEECKEKVTSLFLHKSKETVDTSSLHPQVNPSHVLEKIREIAAKPGVDLLESIEELRAMLVKDQHPAIGG